MTQSDGVKITDAVAVGIVETQQRSPEHIDELNRRRKQVPQQWYPFLTTTACLDWDRYIKKGSWLKVVFKNGDVLVGILAEITPLAFLLQHDTVLLNDGLSDLVGVAPKSANPIIQAHTDDEAMAKASKKPDKIMTRQELLQHEDIPHHKKQEMLQNPDYR